MDCQRQLSRQNISTGLFHILALAQQWTIAFDYADVDALIATVKHTNALERSRAEFTLTMPNGIPLRCTS